MENTIACIFSVKSTRLSDEEKTLFEQAKPYGFILFQRNCETPNQVNALTRELKAIAGWDCPILIDQEGGRVQRLNPPHWGLHKPMKYYGDLCKKDPSQSKWELMNDTDELSSELLDAGINVNCAPVLDVLTEQTHEIIGDRAFSSVPDVTAQLGLLAAERFLHNKITPIVKHIPGHGRAKADSHLELPVVDTSLSTLNHTDFVPFAHINKSQHADKIWAMTAHIIYTDIDEDNPISISAKAIKDFIRGDIGFKGVLLSDDLDMKALDQYGDIDEKCTQTLDAGCDIALYCWGEIDAMQKIAKTCPQLRDDTLERLQKWQEPATIAA